jgi:uncharacterized membrane protein YqgA involved in biofilm formation
VNAFIHAIPIFGSLVNALAILLGGGLGLLFRSRLPEKPLKGAFGAIALFILYLGVDMARRTGNPLILILSLVIGAVLGEMIDIDRGLARFAEVVRRLFRGGGRFSEAFLTSSLLFCIGSMAVLGAVEEGMGGYPSLYLTKALIDGFSALALAAALGAGVLVSALPILLYEGGLTLAARALAPYLTPPVVNEVSAVGGILLMGLALGILEIKQIKVANLLPALLVAALLALVLGG